MRANTSPPAAEPAAGRPLRRDAARNQELVIAAAREVIAELGTEASMETIASRAGVGVGTVYRRYPSKDALIEELVRLILDELITAARRALDLDDGTGLEQFFRDLGRSLVAHHNYADQLVGSLRSDCAQTLRSLMADLLEQAKRHQRVSDHVTFADVMSLTWGLRGLVQTTAAVAPHGWERHLDIHFTGLRSRSLADLPPGMTDRQLARITRRPGPN